MTAHRRVLVLAIDAANPGLLRRWAEDGTLPHLQGLLASGLHAATRSVEGLFIGATWPSFYTGVNPARHGFFWLEQLRTGTYEQWRAGPAEFARRPAIWELLSAAGRRVAVLDVPLTRLSPGLNGIQTVEWGVHDPVFGFQASPRGLKREILGRFGRHPAPPNCNADQRTATEYATFADQLCRGAARRANLTRHLLGTRPWDFAIQVFSEAHCAGHQLWHSHDPDHPAFQAYRDAGGENLIRRVYVAIDRAVGEILAATGPDVMVALVVLHGMSFTCGAAKLLPDILERLGIVTVPPPPPPPPAPGRLTRLRNQAAALYHELPEGFRRPLYQLRQSARKRLAGRQARPLQIDPRGTRAFGLDLGFASSGIRLNLVGREPSGLVKPGAEADAFCHELREALLEIRNPDTGRPIVSSIRRASDLFAGPFMADLPDLIVEWDLSQPLGTTATGDATGAVARAWSDRTGLIERTNGYCRTGEHRNEGLVVFRGPGIAAGPLNRVVSNLDLAPTLAALLGCSMPDTDGAVIPEALPRSE